MKPQKAKILPSHVAPRKTCPSQNVKAAAGPNLQPKTGKTRAETCDFTLQNFDARQKARGEEAGRQPGRVGPVSLALVPPKKSRTPWTHLAVGQNQWDPIFGVGEFTTHFFRDVTGDRDVHWG